MKMGREVLTCLFGVAACGCLGSVNPIVPEDAAVFEPQLLGTWSGGFDPAEQAVVTQAGPRSYAIEYTDHQGATVSLVGQLGRTGGRLVLDVQATAAALGPYRDLVLRLHVPVMLDSIGPQIQVANLEADSLDRYLRAHPRAIAHGRCRAYAPILVGWASGVGAGAPARSRSQSVRCPPLEIPT